jgi:peptidoglycan hydrolase CwlO-like protein
MLVHWVVEAQQVGIANVLCWKLFPRVLIFVFSLAAKSWGGGGGGGAALTSGQQSQIQMLEERDADFDKQLDEIGEGIQDLAEIAALQGEEVKRQAVMLENVNNKMDRVNERMLNVNAKMKDTLEQVGRASDKMCVDIMCVVLMIGFAAVIYKFLV